MLGSSHTVLLAQNAYGAKYEDCSHMIKYCWKTRFIQILILDYPDEWQAWSRHLNTICNKHPGERKS